MILAGLLGALAGGAAFILVPRRAPVMATREWNRSRSGGAAERGRAIMQSGDEGLVRAASSSSHELSEARIRTLAAAIPGAALGAWAISWVIGLPVVPLVALGAVAGAAAGYFIPIANLKQTAEAKRRQLADGTTVFLDLASVMMKGGLGAETALQYASELGEGAAFDEFRDAIAIARQRKIPILDALADVGEWYGVPELSDLRRTSAAAAASGSGLTLALSRAAAGLRADRLRRLRAKAERQLTALQMPSALLIYILMGYMMYGVLGSGLSLDPAAVEG